MLQSVYIAFGYICSRCRRRATPAVVETPLPPAPLPTPPVPPSLPQPLPPSLSQPLPPPSEEVFSVEKLETACRQDDCKVVVEMREKFPEEFQANIQDYLSLASGQGSAQVVRFLLEKKDVTSQEKLNKALERACLCNRYIVAEILVQAGADVLSGLRVASSSNIIRMLQRYETKTENIK